jgi:hypothetical protein
MARRCDHYEAAFEDYLRGRSIPYLSVDETRRSVFAGVKIKSFDYLVYPPNGRSWLVDVKGRHFPYVDEQGGGKRYWESWITREDVAGLTDWESVFGTGYEARLVFAYLLQGPPDRWPSPPPHVFDGESYVFYTVGVADYERACRERSERWQTVSVPNVAFRQIIRPLEALLAGGPPAGRAGGGAADLPSKDRPAYNGPATENLS